MLFVTFGFKTFSGIVHSVSDVSKISLALEAAFMGLRMAKNKRVLRSGDGLIKENADATVEAIGTMAKEGMKSTDKTIVEIMLEK